MTPEELTNLVTFIDNATVSLEEGVGHLRSLVDRVKIAVRRTDPLMLPLTQAEADHIITTYLQPYLDALTAIEAASDLLGTDGLKP